jgi:myo-inositol-1(or 4)-monophosphatase
MAEETNLTGMLDYVKQTARRAGDILREAYDRPRNITYKGEVDLVTETDLTVEAFIISALQERYPDIGVLAEEGGEVGEVSEMRWLIDPLDGTNSFAHGIPIFCVSIGLRGPDGPVLGVIYDPLRDECFSALRGQGAWLNDRPCRVSSVPRLGEAMLATGFPYERRTIIDNNSAAAAMFLRRAQGIRRLGSAALDMAYVACGRFDGLWEWGVKPWDIGAGLLLVKEAGGRLTNYAGRPVDDLRQNRQNVVASNGLIHDEMLAVLAQIYEFTDDGDFILKNEYRLPGM